MQILPITFYSSCQYAWQLSLHSSEPPLAEGDTPLSSIEACLQEAGSALFDEEPFVQLWYRNFCMGTIRTNSLPAAASEIAERIVSAYADLRDFPI